MKPQDKFGHELENGCSVYYWSSKGGLVKERTREVNYVCVVLESGKEVPLEKVAYADSNPSEELQKATDRCKKLSTLKLYKCRYLIIYNNGDWEHKIAGDNLVLAHNEKEAGYISANNVPFDGTAWTSVFILSVERVWLAQDENKAFWADKRLKEEDMCTVGDYRDIGQCVDLGDNSCDWCVMYEEDYINMEESNHELRLELEKLRKKIKKLKKQGDDE